MIKCNKIKNKAFTTVPSAKEVLTNISLKKEIYFFKSLNPHEKIDNKYYFPVHLSLFL